MAWVRLSAAARNAAANAIVDLIDGGSSNGTVKIYTGTAPTNPDTALGSQILLATLTFSDPAFTASDAGTVFAEAISDDTSADTSGTAAWARISDSAGTAIIDVDVGVAGATLNLNTTEIIAGATVRIVSGSFTMPSGT